MGTLLSQFLVVSPKLVEFGLIIELLLLVPRQWKDDWALRFVSFETGNRNEAGKLM